MAVLEDVPGIKVTVRIGGVDCTEYDDPEVPEQQPAQPTSLKYIESPDDAKFAICVAVDDSYKWGYKNHVLSFVTFVDSEWIESPIVRSQSLTNGQYERLTEGKKVFRKDTKTWSIHGLKFSAVKTIDEAKKERVEKDRKTSDKLGVIEVKVWRGVELGPSSSKRSSATLKKTPFELSEKSLKGKSISHGTMFSTAKQTTSPGFVSVQYLPEDGGPIAIFRFTYRSRRALQQELIIPATPPPRSPTFDGLSEAELRRLARERYEQINEEKEVKKEKASIKRELGDDKLDRPSKVRRVSKTIDLTDE
ncbi:hypothetical protein F5Y13DRAFT_65199 [Hypoxylon sp. FL1857]|nr:hypothetical protein F5Y13DRAFT_65199 [Hypoxylon sp. FL1857]